LELACKVGRVTYDAAKAEKVGRRFAWEVRKKVVPLPEEQVLAAAKQILENSDPFLSQLTLVQVRFGQGWCARSAERRLMDRGRTSRRAG
jgi:hypothetical protein